jgi:microcystin-dependent protein
MPHRPGFLIPNSGDVAAGMNRQAEPDAGDFSVLGTNDYGILTGFDFTIVGGSLRVNTVSGVNVALIDGEIYRMNNSQGGPANLSVALARGTAGLDRFDLVVFDRVAGLTVLSGTPDDAAPVFPFLPATCVPIASVWVPSSVTDPISLSASYVVDKRRWLLNGARGTQPADGIFLDNRIDGEDVSSFRVFGDGTTKFGKNITFKPQYPTDGPKLVVDGGDMVEFQTTVSITESLTVTKKVTAGEEVRGSNILVDYLDVGAPPDTEGSTGSIFQETRTGRLYIKQPESEAHPNGHWAEVMADEYPPGTIISTLLSGPAALLHLPDTSWLLCDGRQINADSAPRLRDAFPQWVNAGILTLPDLRDTFLGSSFGHGEQLGKSYGKNVNKLTAAQLAPHTHLSSGSTLPAPSHSHGTNLDTYPAGGHTHSITGAGIHQHYIPDPTHVHIGADHGSLTGLGTFTYFIEQRWGGRYVLDLHPAGAGHGTVVDITDRTMPAKTGITNTANDGDHGHSASGVADHRHTLNLAPDGGHSHVLPAENTVGTSVDIENRPKFTVVNWYIKA